MTKEQIKAAYDALIRMAADHAVEYSVSLSKDEWEILTFHGQPADPSDRAFLDELRKK